MALARQATDIYIILTSTIDDPSTDSDDRLSYQITIQNKGISITPEFYGGSTFDETIGARRISNLRGFRVSIDLSYGLSKESVTKRDYDGSGTPTVSTSTFRDMFNEIMSAFRNGTFEGGTKTFRKMIVLIKQSNNTYTAILDDASNDMAFIPSEMSYQQTYTNQIGRFTPSISIVSQDLITEIGSELEGIV